MNIFIRGFVLFIINIIFMTTCYAQVSFITNGQNIKSSNAWDIHLVDLNGDSFPDACFENKVWLNDGKGNFTNQEYILAQDYFRALPI